MPQSPLDHLEWNLTFTQRQLGEEAEKLSSCANSLLTWISEEYGEDTIAVEVITVARDLLDVSRTIKSKMSYLQEQFAEAKPLLKAPEPSQ